MKNKLSKLSFVWALIFPVISVCEPLFESSVASNDIDFIRENDPSVSANLEFIGNSRQEMPDKRTNDLFDNNAYIFRAGYDDNTSIEILGSSAFPTVEVAARYAEMLLGPVGKLPYKMRDRLAHIVVLQGNEGAFAEDQGHFFVVYSENMDLRFANNDLEETVFHESVHATLDEIHNKSKAWLFAQQSDDVFITNYASSRPKKEDLAESALFAYTYLRDSSRLPPYVKIWIENRMPNRLNFFENVFGGEN